MKYIFLAILVLVVVILLVCYFIRKKKAIAKVRCMSDEEKISHIDAALFPFGFAFDLNCDVVVSKNDVWQRDLGYMDLYDYKAPFFYMVFDADPICFKYKGREYRIELWKGQYGITTGAEIGIYVRYCNSGYPEYFYPAATDDERLKMQFVLMKKCDLFCRCDNSWWLTGFDVGAFSKPKNLKMDVCIHMPDCDMRDAFIDALIQAGYSHCQINICGDAVCFEYCCPNSKYKPNRRHRLVKCIAQLCNYINCHMYMWFTRCFNRTLDKLTYLRFMAPCLYRFIIKLSVPRRKQKKYIRRIYKNRK